MDYFFRHIGPLTRRYPSDVPVKTIGYLPAKEEMIDYAFPTCNFSIILKGEGTYLWQGKRHTDKAPCVITQWPGIPMLYGPATGTTWAELFIMYGPETVPVFEARKLLSREQPFWDIHQIEQVTESVAALANFVCNRSNERFVDRVDRLCECLILETHFGPRTRIPASRMETTIESIRKHIRNNISKPHHFETLAHEHGLSLSTFRRYWLQYVQTPPAQYLTNLRIQAACRMLVETDLPINEIARKTGFEDAFYFSRCFRRVQQMPPRTYRSLHNSGHAIPRSSISTTEAGDQL